MNLQDVVKGNLLCIWGEISVQHKVAEEFPAEQMSYRDQIDQIYEFIDLAGEYGVAYEAMISLLQDFSFVISGKAAVKLLEVGLLLKYKTEQDSDFIFDSRV